MKRYIRGIITIAVIVSGLAIGASMDREEQAILTMTQEEYDEISDSIKSTTGHVPSDGKIADEWYHRRGD